jgi:ABC-type multidrug transport system permease subunit
MGWYAVYRREMLLLWKKMGKLGYVFSAVLSPLIYLFAFGLGLGGRVNIEGGYTTFLISGIVSVTVMLNAFQQTSLSVSVGRMYFQTFQSLILSSVSSGQVVLGIVLAGAVRGVLLGGLVLLLARAAFGAGNLSPPAVCGMVLGAFCFAVMGVVAGMAVRNPDDVSLIMNFLITPMIFFGGSFFPLQNLPSWLAAVAGIFPIGFINILMRATAWHHDALWAAASLAAMTGCLFGGGVWLVSRYSE